MKYKKTKSTFAQLHEANLRIRELEKEISVLKYKYESNKDEVAECSCSELQHVINENSFPYGDTVEFDKCIKCGEVYNFKTR